MAEQKEHQEKLHQTLTEYAPNKYSPGMDRREFMQWNVVAWGTFAAACGVAALPLGRFLFPNVLFEPIQSFKAGFPDDYEVGAVSTKWLSQYQVWIVREADGFYALLAVCTHLGCTPAWLAGEGKFKCPCHGSGFRMSGVNFEGPAPRPLERVGVSLSDDGQLFIDKSKIFQQEKNQWGDPGSYLVYAG